MRNWPWGPCKTVEWEISTWSHSHWGPAPAWGKLPPMPPSLGGQVCIGHGLIHLAADTTLLHTCSIPTSSSITLLCCLHWPKLQNLMFWVAICLHTCIGYKTIIQQYKLNKWCTYGVKYTTKGAFSTNSNTNWINGVGHKIEYGKSLLYTQQLYMSECKTVFDQ